TPVAVQIWPVTQTVQNPADAPLLAVAPCAHPAGVVDATRRARCDEDLRVVVGRDGPALHYHRAPRPRTRRHPRAPETQCAPVRAAEEGAVKAARLLQGLRVPAGGRGHMHAA